MPAALTAATVKAAIRDSRAGKRWAKADGLMPGLQLRAQPTGARWTVRARLNDLTSAAGISAGSARATKTWTASPA